MGEAAAHGAPVADHTVRHEPHRIAEQRAHPRHERRVLDRRLACERLHGDTTITLVNAIQAADAVDVDQVLRSRQAEVEERHERLPAG